MEVAVAVTCLSICLSKAKGIRAPQPVLFPARDGGGRIGYAPAAGHD